MFESHDTDFDLDDCDKPLLEYAEERRRKADVAMFGMSGALPSAHSWPGGGRRGRGR